MADEILTLKEVAALLKIGERTVYRLVQEGRLPGFKVGGAWRFHRARLDNWIDTQTEAAGRAAMFPDETSESDD